MEAKENKSRDLSAVDLLEVHETKRAFGGAVIPSEQAKEGHV